MKNYLNVVFNHFRALQAWSHHNDAQITLNVRNFELEVKWRNRYFNLYPLFQTRFNGISMHSDVLSSNVFGFGGWRPYKGLRHDHSTDKRLFKEFIRNAGLCVPDAVQMDSHSNAPHFDYIVKSAAGSFGREILGPYPAHCKFPAVSFPDADKQKAVFAERFIPGKILKVWFWGGKSFFAHVNDFPIVTGDGIKTLGELIREKIEESGSSWEKTSDQQIILNCLRLQGVSWEDKSTNGVEYWIDFRYSQHYQRSGGPTSITDDGLPYLQQQAGSTLQAMGKSLVALLSRSFSAPVMISVDGMLDSSGKIWWLEMNTNSVVPPELYPTMFAELFA